MESAAPPVKRLRGQIAQTRFRLRKLQRDLAEAEAEVEAKQHRINRTPPNDHSHSGEDSTTQPTPAKHSNGQGHDHGCSKWPLQAEEYRRYGRQLILPQIGLHGQLNLKRASVLIVGLGGLGCPAAAYLAGAGVGQIGLIDGDTVETSNLHRQIIHSSSKVGEYKVHSAAQYLQNLNPLPKCKAYPQHLRPEDAVALFEQYDLILDCTDHPTSRYMISDAAVLAGKPLVSASALGMEGQLLVLNDGYPLGSERPGKYCYRCVFPKPPSPEAVLSCAEGGILGPVVGLMGTLMATAALKILVKNHEHPIHNEIGGFTSPPEQPSMLLYSADSEPPFRTVRIKGQRNDCPSCGNNPTITKASLLSGSLDYIAFCGQREATNILEPARRISPAEFLKLKRTTPSGHCILVDVRDETEFDLGHIEGSVNAPIRNFMTANNSCDQSDDSVFASIFPWSKHERDTAIDPEEVSLFTICRQSNDSQVAARYLQEHYPRCRFIGDIKGGLEAWRKDVDPTFPDY